MSLNGSIEEVIAESRKEESDVRVAFRNSKRPGKSTTVARTNSFRSSSKRHSITEEKFLSPDLNTDGCQRCSIRTSATKEEINSNTLYRASLTIRDNNSIKDGEKVSDSVAQEMIASKPEDEEYLNPDDYNPVIVLKNLPPYDSFPEEVRNRKLLPPKREEDPEYTLVLDLDETMLHCSTVQSGPSNWNFSIVYEGQIICVYANIRPYLEFLLKKISPYYEIIVFTASQRIYADTILDLIDGENHYISHRLYRDSCIFINHNYIKDLNALNRDLSKTVIVDNCICNFAYSIENGIPIISWYDDEEDHELYNLYTVLLSFLKVDDIRPSLNDLFHLKHILEEFTVE